MHGVGKDITPVSIEDYQSIFKELMRDDIQIVIPRDSKDMFSEEIQVLVSNMLLGPQGQKFEVKVLNQDHIEIRRMDFIQERVALVVANRMFFALYTNRQQLHLFSATTCQQLVRGVLIEGVCMVA